VEVLVVTVVAATAAAVVVVVVVVAYRHTKSFTYKLDIHGYTPS
jgi:NADH:ubiquinone oxidoreductase subunit K